ncbi:hypothetical protein ACTA71_012579 [Dictyostelium dimigraforme]
MDDLFLHLTQPYDLYFDLEPWDSLNGLIVHLEENRHNIIFQNSNLNQDYQEMIGTLSGFRYHSNPYYKELSNVDYRWFIRRFNEINIPYSTLMDHQFNEEIQQDDRTAFIQSLLPTLVQLNQLRRLLSFKICNVYLNTISIPPAYTFTFSEIQFTYVEEEIYNWREINLKEIYRKIDGNEELAMNYMNITDLITYKLINCNTNNDFKFIL